MARQSPGQVGWDFGPAIMGTHYDVNRARNHAQDRAMAKVRETKAAVANGSSVFAGMDWTGAYCTRCGHTCSGNHRPGSMGRCRAMACDCLYCEVDCACSHASGDHESWGAERSLSCAHCECPVFRPGRSPQQPQPER